MPRLRISQRLRSPVLAVMFSLGVAGCATAPVEHEVQNSQTLDESKDVVWERAVAFFAANNLSIKTIEKASGIIAVDRQVSGAGGSLAPYADCGTAPLMRTLSQTVDLNLFVRPLGEQKTSVVVNTRFTETRILGENMMTLRTITCVSTGKIEGDILAALQRSL